MYQFLITIRFKKKNIYQTFCSIQNVGKKKTFFICKTTGLLPQAPFKCLTDFQIRKIAMWIESTFKGPHVIGKVFVKIRKNYFSYLIKLGTIKSIRLSKGLPVRGQRTHTNARTCKRILFLVL